MATTTTRLQFTQTDLPNPAVRKAARKAAIAADRAAEAKEKLPVKHKLRRERETAANTLRKECRVQSDQAQKIGLENRKRQRQPALLEGKTRQEAAEASSGIQLRFTEEPLSPPSGKTGNIARSAASGVSSRVRNTIRKQNQDENTGVQSAQFAEGASERTLFAVDHAAYSRRLKQYANAERLEKKADAANVEALYQKSLKDNHSTASNPISRWRQKQEIKRQYAAIKAGQHAGSTNAASIGKKAVDGVKAVTDRLLDYATSNSKTLILIGAAALLLMVISGGVSSCTAVFSSVSNGVLATSFTAETEDILGAEADYCAKEAALRARIQQLQTQGGYDEYRLNADEIGHNPWELAALLTVLKEDYSRSEVQSLLQEIFEKQYSLSTATTTDTVTAAKTVQVGESLGTVTTSAYCSCSICCGQWAGGPTASGVYPQANHTLAVDARNPFVPMGTKVIMNGVEYKVEDTGNFAR